MPVFSLQSVEHCWVQSMGWEDRNNLEATATAQGNPMGREEIRFTFCKDWLVGGE